MFKNTQLPHFTCLLKQTLLNLFSATVLGKIDGSFESLYPNASRQERGKSYKSYKGKTLVLVLSIIRKYRYLVGSHDFFRAVKLEEPWLFSKESVILSDLLFFFIIYYRVFQPEVGSTLVHDFLPLLLWTIIDHSSQFLRTEKTVLLQRKLFATVNAISKAAEDHITENLQSTNVQLRSETFPPFLVLTKILKHFFSLNYTQKKKSLSNF